MNKQDFIKLLAAKAGSSATEADKWFKSVTDTIGDAIQKTDDLRFVGFGSFKSKIRKASDVKTPRGDTVHVPEKRVVTFSVGSELKEKALTKVEPKTADEKKADNNKKAAAKKSAPKPKKTTKAKK